MVSQLLTIKTLINRVRGPYWGILAPYCFTIKTTEGQHFPARLEHTCLVSVLLYGTWAMCFPPFEKQKIYTAYVSRNLYQERTNQNAQIWRMHQLEHL